LPKQVGNAGNVEIRTGLLRISDPNSGISTSSGVGDGGNIRLQLERALVLRSGGEITTSAGVLERGGNGGDIAIESPFVVAVPRENSRISAQAFTGQGGNISIKTTGLYGIEPRSTSSNLRDRPTRSEITASSQLGIQGEVNIIRPEVEPTQGTIELPTTPIPGNQISQTCSRESRSLGSFVVSGRGSAPPNPTDTLSGTQTLPPLAKIDQSRHQSQVQPRLNPSSSEVVEAQGWIKTRDGKVILVARTAETTPPIVAACPE
jgi:large exoprotein involved in heme utilization and adhesion